ncbi:MAG: dienelactone hydrolase family protein, partial [Acidimicrobiales bacterium]
MTVLKGEGKVPILFGSMSVSVASRVHSGYLSRPDLTGEWPTVILVPDSSGVTPAVKDLCRKLARRELAAVAVDPLRRDRVSRLWADRQAPVSAADLDADIDDIVSFVANPSGSWSSAELGFGVLGIGAGGAAASRLTVRRPGLAVALVAAPVQPELLASAGALLGLYGRDDDGVPV